MKCNREYCHFIKEGVRDLASFRIDEEEINDEETDVILRIIKRTIKKSIKDESNMGRIIHKKEDNIAEVMILLSKSGMKLHQNELEEAIDAANRGLRLLM
jgi:hypothetical protein